MSHTKVNSELSPRQGLIRESSFTVAKFGFMILTSSSDIPFIKEQCCKHTYTFQSVHCKLETKVKRF